MRIPEASLEWSFMGVVLQQLSCALSNLRLLMTQPFSAVSACGRVWEGEKDTKEC